jgi:hypothetical protein
VSRLLVAQRALTVPGWVKEFLWRKAQAAPSLDLRFADNKSLADAVTGQQLVTFTRASSGTFVDSAGTLQTAATDVPRFDHNPTTGESLGLLVEEARTNLLLRSEEFDNAVWNQPAPSIATVTPNAQIAPNGTLTADTFTTVSGTPALFQAVVCLASTAYTWSFYVKLGTMAAADFRFAVRDDTNGAFIATDIAPSITPVTTEWRRVTYTFTTPVGCVLVRPYPYRFNPATYGTTVHLWGADLQSGASPTSYIPTTTAAATRAADVASITGSAFSSWYNATEGTIFHQGATPTTANFFSIDDGTVNNRITSYLPAATAPGFFVATGGVAQANIFSSTITAGSTFAQANSYKAANFAIAVNGGTIGTSSSGSIPVVNKMVIGANVFAGAYVNGTIRRLVFWPQALPSRLQSITQ